jgi:AcrR family transcriptional regulator
VVSTETHPAPRGTARAPLSRQRVLAAALAYVDEHGLDGLTMHKLAAELGAGAMSLYNHVRNKDDLLVGISELVWQEAAAAAPPAADDAAWLRALGRAIRHAGRRHPKALPALVSAGVFPPAMLEVIAGQFDRAGPAEPDARLLTGIATVTAFALGWAITGSAGAGPAAGPARESERQRIRRVTRALPPETPDRLVDTAIAVCAADTEAMFATGLEAIITGCGVGGTPASPRTTPPRWPRANGPARMTK